MVRVAVSVYFEAGCQDKDAAEKINQGSSLEEFQIFSSVEWRILKLGMKMSVFLRFQLKFKGIKQDAVQGGLNSLFYFIYFIIYTID